MAGLIRNLLDMTRVQGAIDLNLDWHGADELVINSVERTEREFDTPVEVVLKDSPVVKVDGALMEQVLVNILENAARHVGRQVKVVVTISRIGSTGLIEIRDDGPGVPPGEETRVFERFQRHDSTGFGLGLAICKAAVEAHGGTITVRNGEPHGAIFLIRLPIPEEPAA
jgi:two-component system sensor histidine kinase KdpD